MNKITVADINFRNRRALVRVDFNVPLDDNQQITDDRRIRAALPTIKKILDDGGIVVACSHLGRPKGKHDPKLSLRPVSERLSQLLDKDVVFAEDCIGPEASNVVDKLQPGEIVLLENLRFHEEEKKNDSEFASKLARLGDVYVNDAFGTAHRAHASTEGVTKHFDQAVAGFLMEKELKYLGEAIADPKRPYAAILGGAKISGKIDVITNLLDKVDLLLIGGGMVFTFGKAKGYSVGDSLVEEDRVEMAREIMAKLQNSRAKLVFPVDAVVASGLDSTETDVVGIDNIPNGKMGLDIGPKTIELFGQELQDAQTIVWNGPMGVFEREAFAKGTFELARLLAKLTDKGATTIIGGGDSASAVQKAGVDDKLSHISTGGGASLEFLEGKELPGVAALTNASSAKAV
ncbi:phosphoglycerate kinase [candidate division GN15 bacterium]|nr:phosphoglycerate kinase [candidate division GN15 bacterium]